MFVFLWEYKNNDNKKHVIAIMLWVRFVLTEVNLRIAEQSLYLPNFPDLFYS